MNVEQYLRRIGLRTAETSSDLKTLSNLQVAHLLTVPFENLDIHWGRPITLDTAKFYIKLVDEKRGGFCYELNGAFNDLLRELGFQTRLVSARVFTSEGRYSPDFAHAAIIVMIGDFQYLVDVGFGDFTSGPLEIALSIEQDDREGTFVLRNIDPNLIEVTKKEETYLAPQYTFDLQGRDLAEFKELCDFQQYSPESHFTQGKVCSLLTPNGRKTITDAKLIITSNGVKTEKEIGSELEFYSLLDQEFNIRRPH